MIIDDGTFPDVPVVDIAGYRCAPHIVTVFDPSGDQWTSEFDTVETRTSDFYQVFPDHFDFLNVASTLPSFFLNRGHIRTQTDVTGIGTDPLDNDALFGSAGQLLGVTMYPLDTFFDLGTEAANHERGHQWINSLDGPPLLADGAPHWPASTMARGIMGFGTGEGLNFPYDLVHQAASTWCSRRR